MEVLIELLERPPSIPCGVLSNWYPIGEGILLYGATYDSTEHFWQAVTYHLDITVAQLAELLGVFQREDWKPWLARLDDDPVLVSAQCIRGGIPASQSRARSVTVVSAGA